MAVSVTIENLGKTFGHTCALNDVGLQIKPGELFFLLGPSGCGKTTLLRCIAGFCEPDIGHIHLGNRDITRLPPHRRDTGMVFQSYALWPHMNVRDNVAFGLEMRRISESAKKQRVAEALELVRMSDRADAKPNELSGGQQQRIALARALVVHPQCLLLDEPLSNLDAKLRLEMRHEIRRICKEAQRTAIYVTHDQKEALSIADRLAVINYGRIQQIGTPHQVYSQPANKFVAGFIGETNFMQGNIIRAANGDSIISTPIGIITSAFPIDPPGASGKSFTVSIRPESVRLDKPPWRCANVLQGTIQNTMYLGEMAQHEFHVSAGNNTSHPLKIFEINPRNIGIPRDESLTAWIDPADVVLLRD